MIDLAVHILDSKAGHFEPKSFVDRYENALKALVKRKAAGKPIEAPKREDQGDNVIDLMEALKQSLGKGGRKPASSARRGGAAKKARRAPAGHRKAG
jgi:non-homologous end joining protein Ku